MNGIKVAAQTTAGTAGGAGAALVTAQRVAAKFQQNFKNSGTPEAGSISKNGC